MGKTGHPLEKEYNPLQAGLIAAGAATDSGINQAKRAFQQGTAALAGMSSNPVMQAAGARMHTLSEQTKQQMHENAALYKPLREAYPYMTAVGEAVPAAVPGGLPVFGTQAAFNLGRAYLDEVARAADSAKLKALADALRKF